MKIPVKAAKAFAQDNGLQQVIIFGWDGTSTHVVTYGDTVEACAIAAEGANRIKKGWDWPEKLLAEPSRVKKLQDKIKELEKKVSSLTSENSALTRKIKLPYWERND